MSWDMAEREAVYSYLLSPSLLRTAIIGFAADKRDQCRQDCTSYMTSIPRKLEHAADCAAKAEVWGSLMHEIENEFKRVTAGPTGK